MSEEAEINPVPAEDETPAIPDQPVEVKPEEQGEVKAEIQEEAKAEAKEETQAEEKAEAKEEEQDKEQAQEQEKVGQEVKVGEKKWYIIQTYTGQEDKVKENLEIIIKDKSLENKVFRVLVPTEEIVELKSGKRVVKVRKMFPGYVFIEMALEDETWYIIRGTPGVARFIGTKTAPTPVADREMQRILRQLGEEKKFEITFEKGETVRIISGPFRGYTGTVDELNPEKGKLKVLISIFGRDTPVEVNFEHAEKIV